MRALLMGTVLLQLLFQAPSMQGPEGAINPGYWERSPLPQMGKATYYAQGMMEYVVEYRSGRGQLPRCDECVGAVALLRAGDIGRKVWLQPPGGELAGPFLVVDCARRDDVPALVGANWAVDVSYEVGQQWAMTGPLADVIVWPDPEDSDDTEPLSRQYVNPSDVLITAPTPSGPPVSRSALPTRLPVPRGTGDITAPTPFGTIASNDREAGPGVSIPISPDGQVALGRPGVELLLQAARPSSFLEDPTRPPVTAMPSPSATPRPRNTLDATKNEPILPMATQTPVAGVSASGRNTWQELWRFLHSLVTRQTWFLERPSR